MKAIMLTHNRFFTTTEEEAKNIVTEARQEHGRNLRKHAITRKTKGEQEYFVVDVTVEYYKANDLLGDE